MKVLVTGASGGLGRALLGKLAAEQHAVRATTRRPVGKDGDGVEWVLADVLDRKGLRRAVDGVDVVVHLAAVTHSPRPARYYAVNVDGTANLLASAEEAGVSRFVYVSTRAIGAAGGAYSHSKELAEQRVIAGSVPWVILRPGEAYGTPTGDPILDLARDLRRRSWVWVLGDGSHELAPVHFEDVVFAIVRAVTRESATRRTYTLAGPDSFSYCELVQRIEAHMNLSPRRMLHVPEAFARLVLGTLGRLGVGRYVPDQLPRLLLPKSADSLDAARDLDFTPRTLEEGLAGVFARFGDP